MVTNLNLVIRGWSLYYRYVVAKRTFATVDNAIWPMIYKWAKRRHPQKPLKWVAQHYFTNGVGSREWQLNDGKRGLLKRERNEWPTAFGIDGIGFWLSVRTSALSASA
ncbi:group II intron maturase-specific domain-containing protein [Rhizobium ruizarguesonis]